MAEDFSLSELVIPGTYIRVRAEGLISAGGIPFGNIGIVGTSKAQNVTGATHILSDYAGAQALFGPYAAGESNLTRALETAFLNGAGTVYARALAPTPAPKTSDYQAAFSELLKDNVNILIAPEPPAVDWPATVRHITCPALLITADPALGALVTPESAADLQALTPQMRIAHIAGAGHSIHREQFVRYIETVRTFMAESLS